MGAFSIVRRIGGISLLTAGLLTPLPEFASANPAAPGPAAPDPGTDRPLLASTAVGTSVDKVRYESFAAEMPSRTVAGFRMEGDPEVELVFGDIAHFKRHIDTFRRLQERMDEQRARFARATHAAQRTLAAAPRKRHQCPVDVLAEDYAQASAAGLRFRRLGAEFESAYSAIRDLDRLGESTGLTPDYRWQVKKSRTQYRQALSDLREMRGAFRSQLEAEIRARGCAPQALLARAAELREHAATVEAAKKLAEASQAVSTPPQQVVPASTATFFVDNKKCGDTLRVHVDGTLLGEVAPGTRAAFQSLTGRHSLCLLGGDGQASCGETGTLRSAFVHDGWSVTRHCSQQ